MPDAVNIEAGLPEWRRDLNRFCENWIFAFIIAFGIRHFCLELFRIPSASMEPMLLGDPGLFNGDFVVVDKLTPRFRDFQRWDVAVFQYPVPEIESGPGIRPAISADGNRLDDPLLHPLLGRNFVKRIAVLPGEQFYISGGDLFLRSADGTWAIARKPAALQERLWQAVYRAGAQPGYVPWTAEGGAALGKDAPADSLAIDLAGGGSVAFAQPLRNVYLKDGPVAVRELTPELVQLRKEVAADEDKLAQLARRRDAAGDDRAALQQARDALTEKATRLTLQGWERVDGVGMTHPRFTWPATGSTGSIWDLDRWEIKRLTSADEDDPTRRGIQLNELMQEWNGDLRVSFTVTSLAGEPRLVIANRSLGATQSERSIELTLGANGWRLGGTGLAKALTAEGPGPLTGKTVSLAYVDGQVVVNVAGTEVHRSELAWIDPNAARPGIAWTGTGSLTLSAVAVERDLHYTIKGFLKTAPEAANPEAYLDKLQNQNPESKDQAYAAKVSLPRLIRAELLGKPEDELGAAAASAAYGTDPDHPATAPADAYLMLGDNSPLSMDGREWGFVPAVNFRGRGFLVVFPPNRWRVIR